MVLPALFLAGAVGSGVLAGGYKAGREYLASRENKRYWADYQRNTGVTVRYPYKSGYHYNYSAMLSGVHQGFNSGLYGYYGYQQDWWK